MAQQILVGLAQQTFYAPLFGKDALGLKSAITPFLSGDIKIDKFHYLTRPASREDLRNPLRDFFVFIKDKGVFSLSQESGPDSASVEIGPLWHKLKRTHPAAGLEINAINFVPTTGEKVHPKSVANQVSDYVLGATRAGLTIVDMSEHSVDAALAARAQRAAKYLDWPLLLLFRFQT